MRGPRANIPFNPAQSCFAVFGPAAWCWCTVALWPQQTALQFRIQNIRAGAKWMLDIAMFYE